MHGLNGRRELLLGAIVVALFVAVGWRSPVFFSAANLDTLLNEGAVLAVMALAQMCVLLTGGVDLSVAASMALSGMITALLSRAHPELPVAWSILLALAAGLTLGALNGVAIAWLELPPIVVTLGTMSIYRGLVFVLSGGAWVNAHELGPRFLAFPLQRFAGLTHLVWIALLVAALAYVFLHHRRAGRELFALGGNRAAARYVGINAPRREFLVYALTGLLSGLCGYLWVARYAVAYTETALGFEMQTIAACVIGGVSIRGGRGSVAGCLLGAAFLVVLFNALPVIDVSPFWQSAISGAAILAAVILNSRAERRHGKRILKAPAAPGVAGA